MRRDWNTPKPQHARYRVEYRPGRGHVVLDPDGAVVIDPTPFREIAAKACAHLQAEADKAAGRGPRPCMCCGAVFQSAGRGNRLCGACRAAASGLPQHMLG